MAEVTETAGPSNSLREGSSSGPYKLSCELIGHEGDVLALAVFKNGTIVSASKDKTARLWMIGHDGYYIESAVVMTGHSEVVSSVCVIEPTNENPTGFIVTGSNDRNVCVYVTGDNEPINVAQHIHDDVVRQLRASVFETKSSFLSCSNDGTGKLWDFYHGLEKPMAIFSGHAPDTAITCISDLENGLVVTGASDHFLLVHERNGNVLNRLAGHTSCVTDVVPIGAIDFLTCGHDGTLLLWNSLNFHFTNYERAKGTDRINSIAAAVDGDEVTVVVPCGKDRTVRIWHNRELRQTLVVPSENLWNVKILPNQDVVCSSSDNIVRIFTKDAERFADKETMKQYDAKVNKFNEITENINELQLEKKYEKDIPKEKELNQPGEKDGDTVIIRRNGQVKVYRWSQEKYEWLFIGDVLEDKTGISKKPVYNGIKYDYVFSVDVMKNAPLLKLPYNKGQDPYQAANQFLKDNDLDESHLHQVANFILTNIQLQPIINDEVNCSNPFAFNKYISNTSRSEEVSSSNLSPDKSYIPHNDYFKVEQGNIVLIREKLLEFNNILLAKNSNQDNFDQSVSQDQLNSLMNLINPECLNPKDEEINVLMFLLNWPDDIVFPVLDVARLAVLRKNVNKTLCRNEVLHILKRHIQPDSTEPNQMLSFRLLVNFFSHKDGENFCLQSKDEILEAILRLSNFKNKRIELAVSTYILNLIIALNKTFDIVGKEKILRVVSKYFEALTENEAIFRTLLGIGTLVVETKNHELRKNFIKFIKSCKPVLLSLKKYINEHSSGIIPMKIYFISKEIVKLLR